MPTAAIYYYPSGSPLVFKRITLDNIPISFDDVVPAFESASQRAASGFTQETVFGATGRSELRLGRQHDSMTRRELMNFFDFAARGGVFGFSLDTTKSFGGYLTSDPIAGDTSFGLYGNPWADWETTVLVPVNTDLVRLRSQSPEYLIERHIAQTWTPTTLTLATSMTRSMREGPVLMTYEGFEPFLRIPLDARSQVRALMRSRGGLRYLWEGGLPVEEAEDVMAQAGIDAASVQYGTDGTPELGGYVEGGVAADPFSL